MSTEAFCRIWYLVFDVCDFSSGAITLSRICQYCTAGAVVSMIAAIAHDSICTMALIGSIFIRLERKKMREIDFLGKIVF